MIKNILCYGVVIILSTALLVSCSKKPSGSESSDSSAKPNGGTSGIYCVSLGWEENESGQRQRRGFEEAFTKYNVKAKFANANYNAKLQSEQIDAFIRLKPVAIFVTPSDPAGITQACKRVVEAGIPLFVADAIIAGVPATLSICSNDFGMGVWTMDYIARKLGGKGKIGMVDLPNNESWDLRGQGARFALRKYPGIEIVAQFSYDSEGSITSRQAIDNMLTANPKGSLDAIWCAWDGAAQEGAAAIKAAGRDNEIFTTGIDGGKYAFDVIRSGGPFKITMAQSIYYMSYMCVEYCQKYLNGEQVPRFIISPVYAVDKELLDKSPENAYDYDIPGTADKFGWVNVL